MSVAENRRGIARNFFLKNKTEAINGKTIYPSGRTNGIKEAAIAARINFFS